MKLSTSLLTLSASTAMPLAAAFLLATAYVAHREAEVFEQTALLRNRASVAAIDAELRGSVNTLQSLSSGLRGNDVAVLDATLRTALGTQPHWQNLVLQSADGRQIVNARLPFGAALPQQLVETRSFNETVNEARPSIADLSFAPLLNNEPGVAVRVPILIDGIVTQVLTAVLKPDEVAQLASSFVRAHLAIEERDAELMLRGEKLSAQADELRRVDTNRTKLLALIAHELRNPLAPLRTSLTLLSTEGIDAGAQSRAVAIMGRQIKLLERLVDDLNDAGRIDRGQLELRPMAVTLNEIVVASIETCQAQWLAKDQTLMQRIDAAALWICADADRMQQVFVNLLSNAHRYTPRGGCVQIELRADGDHAVCSVSDNGIGFSGSERDRLFGMFVQLGDEKSRPSASLGIGLAVSRAIVELHGGHITAESPGPGLGATFTVTVRMSSPGDPCVAADSKDCGI